MAAFLVICGIGVIGGMCDGSVVVSGKCAGRAARPPRDAQGTAGLGQGAYGDVRLVSPQR